MRKAHCPRYLRHAGRGYESDCDCGVSANASAECDAWVTPNGAESANANEMGNGACDAW